MTPDDADRTATGPASTGGPTGIRPGADYPGAEGRDGGGVPYIGVAAASQPDARVAALARELGQRLAAAGAVIVCGGGLGAMAEVCKGAQAAGGTTVGLLPGNGRAEGNPALSIALPTGLGEGRNVLLVRASDALVAVGGGFGTLSEIALALRTGVPVVGLATWSLALDGRPVAAFPSFDDASEAARAVLAAAIARRGERGAR
jgi:uncharacterized protein (TIGR00725 family)